MRGAFGIIVYLAGIILSSLVKRAAQRTQQTRSLAAEGEEPPALIVEEWLLEGPLPEALEESPAEEDPDEFPYQEETSDLQDWDQRESKVRERPAPSTGEESLERWDEALELSPLARAVIMAEIIREPRARRPWPKR